MIYINIHQQMEKIMIINNKHRHKKGPDTGPVNVGYIKALNGYLRVGKNFIKIFCNLS